MAQKTFTPAEASRTLPLVKRIVADILSKGKAHRELVEDDGPDTVEKEDRKTVLEAELDELFKELDQLGCSFRDWGFEIGLVDFPSEIDGRPVLLCWRSDEPTVSFYHAPDAGYAGRKPIPPALLELPSKTRGVRPTFAWLLPLALVAVGCATRGSISELGRPEFAGTIPEAVELTLVEPRNRGLFYAYPSGAGKGDYHCQIRMEEPAHRYGAAGDERIGLVLRATPTGDRKIKRFEVIAWPLLAKHVIRFKEDGHPPGPPEPLARVSVDRPIPDSESFGVIVSFPAKKLAGHDQIGLSQLVQFEDGWVTIVDGAVLAPSEAAPVGSR